MSHQLKSTRDDKYLQFIRDQPCCVSGYDYHVVAHHVRCLGGGGMGLKPSDYLCLPLHAHHHMRLHNIGERTFWEEHKIDVVTLIKKYMLMYIEKKKDFDYVALANFLSAD